MLAEATLESLCPMLRQQRGRKQLSRPLLVSNMHTARRRESKSKSEVWANARLQSLALSVPHYVSKASEDLNP